MVPLHADRFESQQAFVARGLLTFNHVAQHAFTAQELATA
jgi:hypothetical protein